jgi:hypothetical protein
MLYASHAHADVYHLNDGSVKTGRTLSRPDSAVVQLETLIGTVSFPAERIVDHEPIADIERDYRKLCGKMDLEKLHAQAMLARWCRQKGFYDPMFKHYDRLAPERDEFKSFVQEMALTMDYREFNPSSQHNAKKGFALLKRMATSGPTCRAIGTELFKAMPEEVAGKALEQGMKSTDAGIKMAAIEIAGLTAPRASLERLIRIAIHDRRQDVREAAVGALLYYEHDGIVYPFVRALKSRNKLYRLHAMDALARLRDLRSAGALIANLGGSGTSRTPRSHFYSGTITSTVTGFDTVVATGAAAASPRVSLIQDGVLLDAGVTVVTRPAIGKTEKRRIAEVLNSITDLDYGDDYLLWNEWWKNNSTRILKR